MLGCFLHPLATPQYAFPAAFLTRGPLMGPVASPFMDVGLLDGVLSGLLESMVRFGVGTADVVPTFPPGDVGGVDAGVWLFDVAVDGLRDSLIRRSIASICLLVAPDRLRDWRCATNLLTTSVLSSPWSVLTSFSVVC